jgi:ketosteroid isomerase-like protein
MREGDVAALHTLFSDRLVYVHASGTRDSKSTYLDKLHSGAMRYDVLQLEDLQAIPAGDAVVVTGRMRAEVCMQGQVKPVRSVFMTVWAAEAQPNGTASWRLCAHQGTPSSA